jgi:hypothetical protein
VLLEAYPTTCNALAPRVLWAPVVSNVGYILVQRLIYPRLLFRLQRLTTGATGKETLYSRSRTRAYESARKLIGKRAL